MLNRVIYGFQEIIAKGYWKELAITFPSFKKILTIKFVDKVTQ